MQRLVWPKKTRLELQDFHWTHRRSDPSGVDLDDGHIIVAVAADDGGVVGLAVIQGDLHGGGALHNVIVGDDIAVRAVDKAAAGAGGLHRLAEDVGAAGGGGVDGHHGVHGRGVHLGRLHLGLAVHMIHLHRDRLTAGLLDGDGLAVGAAVQGRAAEAAAGADDGTGQHDGHYLGRRTAEEAGLLGGLGFLRRGSGACGLIVVGGQVAAAAVVILVGIIEAVKFVVIHMDSSFIFGTNCVIIHLDYYHIRFS